MDVTVGGGAEEVGVPAPAPGQVWWARPAPSAGREQAGRRPVLVVAGAEYLAVMDALAVVVPLTTVDRGWSNHVPVQGALELAEPSFAMSEQVRTISRRRLDRCLGTVDPGCLAAVRGWLRDFLTG